MKSIKTPIPEFVLVAITDPFFVKDKDYRIVQANEAFFNLYPVEKRNEIIGYTTVEQYSKEESEIFLANDRYAFENGLHKTCETLRFPDGVIRTFVTTKTRFEGDDGQPFLLGFAQEVTEFLSTKSKLQDSERAREALADISYDGYWDWFIQDDYQYMSPRFWEILGYTSEEKKHKPSEWQNLIHNEDLQLAMKNFDQHIKTHGTFPYRQKVRYMHKNGHVVTVLCSGKVISWADDGTPLRMVGTHTNITEIEKVRQEIDEKNKLLEHAEDAAQIGNFIIEGRSLQMRWSSGVQQILGNRSKALDSVRAVLKCIVPEDRRVLYSIVSKIPHNKPWSYSTEIRYYGLDNNIKWVEISLESQFSSENKKDMRILGTILEITDRKRNEQHLESLNKDLEQFAFVASHDLKAPLHAVKSLVTMVEDEIALGGNDVQELLSLMKKRVVRLETMLDDILSYARTGSGKECSTKVDLNIMIDEIKENLQLSDEEILIVPETLPTLLTEETALTQVFANLIGNAIKHHDKPQKRIEVKFQTVSDTKTRFYVIDDGAGIPEEFRESVFKMLETLRSRDEVEGSGIGLAIVKKIIEAQQETIIVESNETHGKRGTSFHFVWNAPRLN